MYTYTIKTDAVQSDVEAENIDQAAAIFAKNEKMTGDTCRKVLASIAERDGAWIWIESADAPDGDRRGGSTAESLADYLAERFGMTANRPGRGKEGK